MVMKELRRSEVEILLLLAGIRSATRMQVLKFPGARPHRRNRKPHPGAGLEAKKKEI